MLLFPLSPDLPPLAWVLLLALLIDGLTGDPDWLYRRVPHPVALIGSGIAWADRRFNRGDTRTGQIARGAAVTVVAVAAAAAAGCGLALGLAAVPGGWLAEAILASTLLAFRGLYEHVAAVAAGLAQGLPQGLPQGRAAVARIVGRDPDSLDEAGVARAAIESLAENFSDGVVAPALWYLLLGLPGLLAYKTVNTLDSMIGHRTLRHEAFGKAAARLDDAANWPAARLAGLTLCAAALVVPGANARRAWRSLRRDAGRHRSPNAGWPEAALAGALDFALSGPRRYGDRITDEPWIGPGRAGLGPGDIAVALRLYVAAGMVLVLGVAAVATVSLLPS